MGDPSPARATIVRFKAAMDEAVEHTLATLGDLTEEEATRALAARVRKKLGADTPIYTIVKRRKRDPESDMTREGVIQRFYPEVHKEALRLVSVAHNASGTKPRVGRVSKKIYCKDLYEPLTTFSKIKQAALVQGLPGIFASVYRRAVASGGEGIIEMHMSGQPAVEWAGSKGVGLACDEPGLERVKAAARSLAEKLERGEESDSAETDY